MPAAGRAHSPAPPSPLEHISSDKAIKAKFTRDVQEKNQLTSWTAPMAGIRSRSFWVTATLTVITEAAGPVIWTCKHRGRGRGGTADGQGYRVSRGHVEGAYVLERMAH